MQFWNNVNYQAPKSRNSLISFKSSLLQPSTMSQLTVVRGDIIM